MDVEDMMSEVIGRLILALIFSVLSASNVMSAPSANSIKVIVPGGEYYFTMKGPCISRPDSHSFQFVGIDKQYEIMASSNAVGLDISFALLNHNKRWSLHLPIAKNTSKIGEKSFFFKGEAQFNAKKTNMQPIEMSVRCE
jgi:hypothetical protein